jgi:hypothetical protein
MACWTPVDMSDNRRAPMASTTRVFVYALVATMSAFWLNACAVAIVIGGQGGNGPVGLPAAIIHLAYLPSRLWGVPQDQWFSPSLLAPFIFNVAVWAALGTLLGLAHAAVTTKR